MKKILSFSILLTMFFTVAKATVVKKTIENIASENNWSNSSAYYSFLLDSHITVSCSNDGRNGTYSKFNQTWRMYPEDSESNCVDITINVEDGYILNSITFTFSVLNDGTLNYGNSSISSEDIITVNENTACFTAKQGRVYISAISVSYEIESINPPVVPIASIVFNPTNGNTVNVGSDVFITLVNGEATGIKYTTDGSDPTVNGIEGSSVTLNGSDGDQVTIKAVPFNSNSAGTTYGETVYSATYTLHEPPTIVYQRITDVTQLEMGKKYIIVYTTNNADAKVLSCYNFSGPTRPFVNKSIKDFSITVGNEQDDNNIAQFILNEITGAYTLQCTSNSMFLNGQQNSQYLQINITEKDLNNYSKWEITFDNNNTVIKNLANTSYPYVNWNVNQEHFNLSTNHSNISLYKEYIEGIYDIIVNQSIGGTITASPSGEKVVHEGDEVTLTATPDQGYEFTSWNVTDDQGTIIVTDNKFTVRSSNITVTATFSELSNYIECTLAELESEGELNKPYIISNKLLPVYADKTRGILWCKDDNASISKTNIKDGQIDFLYNDTQAQNKRNWDQSNWVALQFSEPTRGNDVSNLISSAVQEQKYIKAKTIKGFFSNDVNYTITMAEDALQFVEDSETVNYTENVYCTVNFLPSNLNLTDDSQGAQTSGNNHDFYFFMNPKVQEVCEITYARWDNDKKCFTVPSISGFNGEMIVNWTYNELGDVSSTLSANNSNNTSNEEFIYRFKSIVKLQEPDQQHDGTTMLKNSESIVPSYVVYPTNLNPNPTNGSVITTLSTVIGNGEVKSVKYVNVAGMVSDVPFQGVNIVVTEYTDGSRTTSKMLKK